MTIPHVRDLKSTKAVWEGEITLFGVKLRVYVLEGNRRIIHSDDMHELPRVMTAGYCEQTPVEARAEMDRMMDFLHGCGEFKV